MAATTPATNPYAPNAAKSKFSSMVQELVRKRKDPNFIRYAMERQGYDVGLVDQELQSLQGYQNGTPAVQKQKLADLSGASAGERQSLADIDATVKMANEAKQMVTGISTGPVAGRVQGAKQMLPSGGDMDFNKLDAKLSNIKSNFMKALSGAAVSEQEVTRLSKFLPSTTDQEEVIKIKLEALTSELSNRRDSTYKSLGIDPSAIENTNETQQPTQQKSTQPNGIEQAKQWLQENPTDPRAEQVRAKITQLDETRTATKNTNLASANAQADQLKKESDYANSFKGFMSNFADSLGENTGMKKFGQGMGATLFLNSAKGMELQDKAAQGDKFALEALQQILDEAPNAKELIGSAAMTALNALSGGLASKGVGALAGQSAKVLSTGEKAVNLAKGVAKGAGVGYGYDVASDLEQDKTAGEVLTPGLGTAIGAVAPLVGATNAVMKARKALRLSTEAERAVGQIVQGTKKDIAPALETFKRIDTKGVNTYEGLTGAIEDNNKALGQAMDEVLARDTTPRKLTELKNTVDVGGKKVTTNYVKQALDDLNELYAKTNSPAEAQRIKNLIAKSKSEGLTVAEINNVAKEYGGEFGNKAFSKKTGEALTSVNAGAYENTRKGVKTTLRSLLPDDTATKIDQAFTENLNTKRLVDDMVKKVNALEQKVNPRTPLQKTGRAIGAGVDIATGGLIKSFFTKLMVESNLGLKSMNSLDMQNALAKNIKKIDAVLNSEPGMFKRNATKLINELTKEYSGKDVIDKAKSIRPGMNIEDVSKKGKGAIPQIAGENPLIQEARKGEADKIINNLVKDSGTGMIKLYHGTDTESANAIRKSGMFNSGKNQPSFFTTSKKEALEYAKNKSKYRGKKPEVMEIEVPKWAVSKNNAGEIETHLNVPLHRDFSNVYRPKDEDVIKAFGQSQPLQEGGKRKAQLEAIRKLKKKR
jgi:hypothetical protein